MGEMNKDEQLMKEGPST